MTDPMANRRSAMLNTQARGLNRWLAFLLSAMLILTTTGCLSLFDGGADDANATITALQATINFKPTTAVPAATSTPQPTLAPTQPPTLPPAPTQPPAATISGPGSTQPAPSSGNIESLIMNSSILLYEDMAGNPDVFRYVAAALERLGFPDSAINDTGDAQGRFLEAMARGGPGGRPWDLIIIANEDQDAIQGTFFEVLEPILNAGQTAVILEIWHLDEIFEGAVKPILLRCGVEPINWEGSFSGDLNLFPLDPNHPVLSEVVRVNQFNLLDYWMYYIDMGDLMHLTGTGDAKLILGSRPGDTSQNGVLTECYNNRLLLQTFSSHNYEDETMVSLWANYVHYMLRKKHGG